MKTQKRLGDYIREVDVRNRDLSVTTLLGVSISKEFIPSIANTIGTDMSTYKIVCKGQFAYGPVTSRNGDKVSIALLANEDNAIISQAYTVFEVKDANELLPEYLMMWFRRPEFDRYARFHSQGSAREVFDWSEMCDVLLPIPSIEQQKEIVSEYETISKRIKLNEQIIKNLEATAQTLYHKMFVEGIDKENLPEGWRIGTLGEMGEIIGGATPSTNNPLFWSDNGISWLSPADLSKGEFKFVSKGSKDITELGYKSCSTKMLPKGSILFSSRAPIGLMAITVDELCTNQGFKSIIPKECIGTEYVYYYLHSIKNRIIEENTGSTFDEVSGQSMKEYIAIIPPESLTNRFSMLLKPVLHLQFIKEQENKKLTELQSLLLAKMGQ
ncbi:MAG: restriction endonuclease subunit S [Bacteroidales bacterium]|nr:restriction endonuclease subunit S [Bacteroidales bacterium]